MTNEEKAKEIAMPCPVCSCLWTKDMMYKEEYCKDCVPQDRFTGAMEMAQWKDEQVKQIQEREIKICNDYIEKHPNNKLMLKYHLGRLSLCDELLGTDSKDKINMAFAAMD